MNAIITVSKDFIKYFDFGYLLRFVTLLLFFRFFNFAFIGLTDTPGLMYSSFVDNYLNYVDGIKYFLLHAAAGMAHLFGMDASVVGLRKILIPGSSSLILGMPCVGLGMLAFWAAFVCAHKYRWQKKLLWTGAGFAAICIINCIRIVFMIFAVANRWNFNRYMNHHDLFKYIAYLFIGLLMWAFYRKYKPYNV